MLVEPKSDGVFCVSLGHSTLQVPPSALRPTPVVEIPEVVIA